MTPRRNLLTSILLAFFSCQCGDAGHDTPAPLEAGSDTGVLSMPTSTTQADAGRDTHPLSSLSPLTDAQIAADRTPGSFDALQPDAGASDDAPNDSLESDGSVPSSRRARDAGDASIASADSGDPDAPLPCGEPHQPCCDFTCHGAYTCANGTCY